MKITAQQVRRIMPNVHSGRVADFVASFNDWAPLFGITTELRAAHYIAQVAHETGQLKYLEEKNIGYDTGVAKVPLVAQSDLFDLSVGDGSVRPEAAQAQQMG